MAKKNSMFSSDDTPDEVIKVNSRRYGTHTRRPRGSVKPARLNATFKKSVSLNTLANSMAKVVKDALDPYRKDFSDGSMWSRSECVTFPIKWQKTAAFRPRDEQWFTEKDHQIVQWSIPARTKTILFVVKCEPWRDYKPIGRTKASGMKIVKVWGL